MKLGKDESKQNDKHVSTDSSLGLTIGLSLVVLFGILMDNIGAGMMFGVATGLCSGSVVSSFYVMRKTQKKKIRENERY